MKQPKNLKNALCLFLMLGLVACGPKDDKSGGNSNPEKRGQIEIKTGVLDGVIKGDSWIFLSGSAKKDPFNKDRYRIDFWETSEVNPCQIFFPVSPRNLLSSIPTAIGEYVLGNEINVTFSYEDGQISQNMVATEGKFVIEKIDKNIINGKLVAFFDKKNNVNGAFSLTVCE
jgi:hypothetical protein